MKYIIPIQALPKVRMVRSDAWKKRPCVLRYWAYKDELNTLVGGAKDELNELIQDGSVMIHFKLKMPKSWSKKKMQEMEGKPHTQKPDKDNLEKAFLDCLMEEDSYVWYTASKKTWSYEPRIEIYKVNIEKV